MIKIRELKKVSGIVGSMIVATGLIGALTTQISPLFESMGAHFGFGQPVVKCESESPSGAMVSILPNEKSDYTFTQNEWSAPKNFELYSNLDGQGRVGTAFARIGKETMPTIKRESIGMVKPTGWHTVRYDDLIKDKYLYNRCHLIAFMLAGENANEKNLMTGTRQFNVDGMLPYENQVAEYVKKTGNTVLYKVTPDFANYELVARGVFIESWSVEDNGCRFRVYVSNVQDGIKINYQTGESQRI